MKNFPYLYRNSRAEARRLKETREHEDSFRLNVSCARAIEQSIRDHFSEAEEGLAEGCAQSVLERYGFLRVDFVLANSLKQMGSPRRIGEEERRWLQGTYVPPDGKYNRYFAVDTAASLLETFIRQTKEYIRHWASSVWSTAFQALKSRTTPAGYWWYPQTL